MTTGLKIAIAIGIGAFLVIVVLVLCLTKVINCGGGGSPVAGLNTATKVGGLKCKKGQCPWENGGCLTAIDKCSDKSVKSTNPDKSCSYFAEKESSDHKCHKTLGQNSRCGSYGYQDTCEKHYGIHDSKAYNCKWNSSGPFGGGGRATRGL